MGKTLYGKVEKNEFNYEWKSEPELQMLDKFSGERKPLPR